jgi:hemerythrin-like domain-containing protein/uncharacterized protein (DUF2249 family)
MNTSTLPRLTVEAEALATPERPSTLLSLFDSLPPGGSFVFVSPESPDWLLATLESQRHGQFDWIPLEVDRRRFRVEIGRRAPRPENLRRISDVLGWDHDRLARLELSAFVARAAGDGDSAMKWYALFSSGLRRHIALEEQILFPLFERRSGFHSAAAPTEVMRGEHRQIERLLAEILRTIGDPARLPDQARAAFHEVLEEHHRKEEGMLYPALDELLTPEEADAVVAEIQRFAV